MASTIADHFVSNDDIIGYLACFVEPDQFLFFASVSRAWREAWGGTRRPPFETRMVTSHTTVSQLTCGLDCGFPYHPETVCEAAALLGNLVLLQWVMNADDAGNGLLPLCEGPVYSSYGDGSHNIDNDDDDHSKDNNHDDRTGVCDKAAEGGHLHVLRWAHQEQGLVWSWRAFDVAAAGGHLGVLQFLDANMNNVGCQSQQDQHPCSENSAASEPADRGRVEGLLDENVCRLAARGGHLSALQWLRQNGCPWDQRACHEAAGGGHQAVLQFLRRNDCPWDESTCSSAARGGHLGILRWLRESGCPWDVNTSSEGKVCGRLVSLHLSRPCIFNIALVCGCECIARVRIPWSLSERIVVLHGVHINVG